MKFIILTFFITLQAIISSAAMAWSPLDSLRESAVESMQQCYSVVAGSDEDQDGEKKKDEEEEEPDCD